MIAISIDELRGYVGSPTSDDMYLAEVIGAGFSMLNTYIGSGIVPDEVSKQAQLIVCSEIYQRRSAPMGIAQFASLDGAPMRVGKDVLASIRPMLREYLEVGL